MLGSTDESRASPDLKAAFLEVHGVGIAENFIIGIMVPIIASMHLEVYGRRL